MKCGVCGQHYGELLVKHAYQCEDDRVGGRVPSSPEIDDYASQIQSESVRFTPEVDDLIKQLEEGQGNE